MGCEMRPIEVGSWSVRGTEIVAGVLRRPRKRFCIPFGRDGHAWPKDAKMARARCPFLLFWQHSALAAGRTGDSFWVHAWRTSTRLGRRRLTGGASNKKKSDNKRGMQSEFRAGGILSQGRAGTNDSEVHAAQEGKWNALLLQTGNHLGVWPAERRVSQMTLLSGRYSIRNE
ncbi:hypothetical protein BC828DRAFT_295911 [Blastocladiella britannica]|nr:hypothetical protein BC828DRAFT_295911 [Blastocladiella britannica]